MSNKKKKIDYNSIAFRNKDVDRLGMLSIKHGIDNNPKIVILFSRLVNGVAGYFNPADEMSKDQESHSNEACSMVRRLYQQNIFFLCICEFVP